ncbi:MAG: DUF502 domain-containing protein [Pseudomonadota bacterium]
MKLPETPPPPRRGFFSRIRASFFTGLAVIAPIGITIWLIWAVVGWIDGWVLPLVPERYNPVLLLNDLVNSTFGLEGDDQVAIRGLGVVTFLIITILVGWVAKGLIGKSLISWAETLVLTIPGVRTIYSGLKQIVETVLAQGEQNFDKACLIEYPRKGIWAIGFISTTAKGEIAERHRAENMVSVFVPTTPNPTSGFLLFFPLRDVIILDMAVEDAAKLIISAGLVYPSEREDTEPAVPDAAE